MTTKRRRSESESQVDSVTQLTFDYFCNHVDTRKPATMYVNHQFQLKDRRRCYRSIRKFLGSTDYRQDLKEVS